MVILIYNQEVFIIVKKLNLTKKLTLFIVGLAILSVASAHAVSDEKSVHISIFLPPSSEIGIEKIGEWDKINMDECGYLLSPGKPMMPLKRVLIELPPYAEYYGIEFSTVEKMELKGNYRIIPSPEIILPSSIEKTEKLHEEWERNYLNTYSSDDVYPGEIGKVKGFLTKGNKNYVIVDIYPFQYHPASGKLFYHSHIDVRIIYTYTLSETKTRDETYNYIIITFKNLYDAIISTDFIGWKSSLGYRIKIVNVTDELISEQEGKDLAQKIRNFLRNYYEIWGIKYVLIVGDYTTVPMRYCYPYGEVPTDAYYADLSFSDEKSWDSDGDGRYGEYGEDNPDFKAEVYVGRIPTNDIEKIKYTLNKIVSFEKDTGEWKKSALHAGAILFFENQDNSGYPFVDGARGLNAIEEDFMNGWNVSHYSEQEGIMPSSYKWNALNEEAFTNDWRNGEYAIVNWEGHGAPSGVSRLIWQWDDGDGVPEGRNEIRQPSFFNTYSNVDDDYPSIVFAVSCNVGRPEPDEYGNLGIKMLTDPTFGCGVAVLSATRGAAVSAEFPPYAGAEGFCYFFNKYIIEKNASVGEALYEGKFEVHSEYAWEHYLEYQNLFDYNLYGDPSMKLIRNPPKIEIIEPDNYIYVFDFKLLPFFKPLIFGKKVVEVQASPDTEKVEFYIDNKLQYVDEIPPYEWTWEKFAFGKYEIRVIAYNGDGRKAEDSMEVFKIF